MHRFARLQDLSTGCLSSVDDRKEGQQRLNKLCNSELMKWSKHWINPPFHKRVVVFIYPYPPYIRWFLNIALHPLLHPLLCGILRAISASTYKKVADLSTRLGLRDKSSSFSGKRMRRPITFFSLFFFVWSLRRSNSFYKMNTNKINFYGRKINYHLNGNFASTNKKALSRNTACLEHI